MTTRMPERPSRRFVDTALCVDRTLAADDADSVLARMVEIGFYSPVRDLL